MISVVNYIFLLFLLLLVAYIIFSFEKKDGVDTGKPRDGKKEVEIVRFCPRCKSTDIVLDTDTHKAAAEFGGKLYYKCRTCGLIAPTFPEMTVERAREIEKEMTKSSTRA